jgi:phosphoglucomutase
MVSDQDEYTPTPVVSHAILGFNRGRTAGLADGIVITPSHNPPHGGPASEEMTTWIQDRANALLEARLNGVKRAPFERALSAPTTRRHDYLSEDVDDLGSVLDLEVVRSSGLVLGVDPLGGAGVHDWGPIAERYKLNLTVVDDDVDPTFRFMALDWDGRTRMDPSSPYAMRRPIGLKDRFDIAFACDTDRDRHGVVA